MFSNIIYMGNIEPEENSSFVPFTGNVGNELPLSHSLRIGEVQLKNVAAGFNVKPG